MRKELWLCANGGIKMWDVRKSFNEKDQELGMLYETDFLTTYPILRFVRDIVSELFVETFHATLRACSVFHFK